MRSFALIKLICLIGLVLASCATTAWAQTPPEEAPALPPVDAPVDAPAQAPMDAPMSAPVAAPVDAPIEAPVQAPADTPVHPTNLYCWQGYSGENGKHSNVSCTFGSCITYTFPCSGSEALCSKDEASSGFVKRAWLCGSNTLCSMMKAHPEYYQDPVCCSSENNCNGLDLDGRNSAALLSISMIFICSFVLIATIINL